MTLMQWRELDQYGYISSHIGSARNVFGVGNVNVGGEEETNEATSSTPEDSGNEDGDGEDGVRDEDNESDNDGSNSPLIVEVSCI